MPTDIIPEYSVVNKYEAPWALYPTNQLDQTAQLHATEQAAKKLLVDQLIDRADARASRVTDALGQNKLSDRELAAWVMNGWSASLAHTTVERALAHRMGLLKNYSDVRPE